MVINFGAGPAQISKEVLEEVQKNLVNYNGTGLSVMEMSHRSLAYNNIHEAAIKNLKDILNVPDNYKILFIPGGATAVFSALCMNLINRTGIADYVVTGFWSSKAAKDAAEYGQINMVIPKASKPFTTIPPQSSWKLDPNASFVFYCDNETVDGLEFDFIPETNGIPLVCDMSSNLLSKPLDVSKFGMIFAGTQKNIGPSGMAVVIIREDLLGNSMKVTPLVLDFSVVAKSNSIYNTPPTFSIYVVGCVLEWIKRKGGLQEMYENSFKKSKLIYNVIEQSNGFYVSAVEPAYRSRMNIPFRLGGSEGNDKLENEFLKKAEAQGMVQLKGHSTVGGIRASLYNSITLEEAEKLANFMTKFYNDFK